MNNLRMAEARSRRSMLGITLIELMIVVTVIAVLGMIAVPSYRQYVMRAQRTEAKSALLQLATNQERYYLQFRTYGTVAQLQAANLLANPAQSERGTYTIAIDAPDAAGYTARATPRAGADFDMTADDQCTEFSLTAQGVKSATGTAAASCW